MKVVISGQSGLEKTEFTNEIKDCITKKGKQITVFHIGRRICKELKVDHKKILNLKPKQLTHLLFPVGNLTKKKVKSLAKKWQLPVADRPESQEICFFRERDYRPFLKRQLKGKIIPGEVVDVKGKVIGKHRGIPLYTVGQRHGFTITETKAIKPFYVIAKKPKKNQLVVGFGEEAERTNIHVRGFC